MRNVRVPLVKDTISHEELTELAEWLRGFPRLTKGEMTLEFERKWSAWQGTKHSVFVNSGSSANLAMFYALQLSGRLRNPRVIVPAISWVTTVSPAMQLGLEPFVCDCDRETLGLDIAHFEALIAEHDPAAVILVHVLGFPNRMDEIIELCKRHSIVLLEDSCESLGSTYRGTKTGNFGLMSSFSLYFGHHLSTVEGGMICTNDDEMAELLTAIRSHGWDRDLPEERRSALRQRYGVDDFRALYTFYWPGFNLRSTDLQAFIGVKQIELADMVAARRNRNFKLYDELIENDHWKIKESESTFVSNFSYPVITPRIKKLTTALSENGIEARPLVCGSVARHPFWFERYGEASLPFADEVHDLGLYLPNNHEITPEEIKFVAEVVNKAVNGG